MCVCVFTYTFVVDRKNGYNNNVKLSNCFVKTSSCCHLMTGNTSTVPAGANIPLAMSDTSLNS